MILLVTYCSRAKKRISKAPAHELYLGPWIKALYKLSQVYGIPFSILSAKYGLLKAEEEIEYYDKKLSLNEIECHSDLISKQLAASQVSEVIYYGNSKNYNQCIEKACEKAGIKLHILPKSEKTKKILGFATLAGLSELTYYLDNIPKY